MKLVPVENLPTERLDPGDDTPKVGEWYWVQETADDEYKVATSTYSHEHRYDEVNRWLACVVHVGSNYAEVKGVYLNERVGLDRFHQVCTAEANPQAYIQRRIGSAQTSVRGLLDEIQRITALLGVAPREQLAETGPEGSNALAIAHGTSDIAAHKKALVKAKKETLPDLFKKVEAQHAMMATWMKADLIPATANLEHMKTSIERIDDRIHTVELYAGLEETLELVRKGKTADNDTKVHVMQRMAFMDEECLANYEAGGMTFKGIKAFDKWLARDDNFRRLLPHDRTILAFRVRRNERAYKGGDSLSAFIAFLMEKECDAWTFLYIRNGQQLWRMHTSIAFEEELFPDQQTNSLLGNSELWVCQHKHGDNRYITSHQRDGMIETFKAETTAYEIRLKQHKRDKAAWKIADRALAKERKAYEAGDLAGEQRDAFKAHKRAEPREPWDRISDDWKRYEKLSPDHLYYDDAMKHIARVAFEHNRIAVIIQGLLDRSTCLQPHPPWRIWTPEGFQTGIVLVYDATRVVTSGDTVDFETYRAQLNRNVRVGSVTIGQQSEWKQWMAGEYERKYGWRRHQNEWHFYPSENPGPGRVATITKLTSKGATFEWNKRTERARWVPADRPGYVKKDREHQVKVSWTCPLDKLFNVSAYTPGDFHLFYDDPRTRSEYLQWAPYLLTAEDYHAGKIERPKPVEDEDGADDD